MTKDEALKLALEAGFRVGPSRDGPDDVWGIGVNLERFAALVIANTPPQPFMSWQEGYEAGRQAERNRMVAYMKQMFDAYSLSSDPSQLKNRSNT